MFQHPTQPSPQADAIPLRKLLEAIEAGSGLRICLKAMAPCAPARALHAQLPHQYHLHRTAFCDNVKITRNDKCIQCDLRDVPALASTHSQPFVNRCHADASEVIIPIPVRQSLVLLGYLGPFRECEQQPASLPLLSPARVEQLLIQCLLLQRYFLYEIEHSPPLHSEGDLRHHIILSFMQNRVSQNPTLPQLAAELNLSPSRAGHLVKELTGRTFVELKLHYRIQAACQMLRDTLLTIEHIAEATGFSDPRYFYRIFREQTGLPPGRWRSSQRPQSHLQA